MRLLIAFAVTLTAGSAQDRAALNFLNHGRPMVDAHNCYPYNGQWTDRIDRALNVLSSTGSPVSIEQDIAWAIDPAKDGQWSLTQPRPRAQNRLSATTSSSMFAPSFNRALRQMTIPAGL